MSPSVRLRWPLFPTALLVVCRMRALRSGLRQAAEEALPSLIRAAEQKAAREMREKDIELAVRADKNTAEPSRRRSATEPPRARSGSNVRQKQRGDRVEPQVRARTQVSAWKLRRRVSASWSGKGAATAAGTPIAPPRRGVQGGGCLTEGEGEGAAPAPSGSEELPGSSCGRRLGFSAALCRHLSLVPRTCEPGAGAVPRLPPFTKNVAQIFMS
ncbi:uncharacterized protein A4U43_C09F15500 [Asparagus officinalis]|uniref:Uncharacterized protein n=1 Tax=Asparagus officinalis TaxID=4686 RepID=A0A5P1E7Y2_ASPOF|nr:uncharacterized protein A4U43_C09F15500 [Asparagus officinalis]